MPALLPLPRVRGGWPCITSDCPWSYSDRGSRLAPDQRRKRYGRRGYKTMPLRDILELPVREIAAPDAFLFLWTTDSHLVDGSAAAVARAWGFEPKRTWTWVKRRPPKVDLRALLRHLHHHLIFADDERLYEVSKPLRKAIKRGLAATQGEDAGGTLAFGGGHYVRTADEKVLICRRGQASFQVHDERSVFFAPPRRNPVTGEIHSTKPWELLEKVERVCSGPRLEMFARSGRPGWTAWGLQAPAEFAATGTEG